MGRGNNSGSRDSRKREGSGSKGFTQDVRFMTDFRQDSFSDRSDSGSGFRSHGGGGGGFSGGGGFGGPPREMHKATCADCGKECTVPFKPIEGRPVYCRECYPKHKRF